MNNTKYNFDFVKNRYKFFIFSATLILIIFLFSAVFGIKMDIQFKGGAMLTYGYVGDLSEDDAAKVVVDTLGLECTIQLSDAINSDQKTLKIALTGTQTLTAEQLHAVSIALEKKFPNNDIQQLEVNNVNPSIGKEFFIKSIVAVIAAFVLILIYVAIRFKKIGGWPAGSMAIVALIHDLIIIFGVFSIMRIPLNGNFIAAVLTILGYSINDTVVIYDRIRENEGLYGKKMNFGALVNLSINQSLVRSINTTVTTMLALGTLCVFSLVYHLDSIFTFAFPLIIGMVSGVYSTVCIAGPLWVTWEEYKIKNKKSHKKAKEK